MEQMILTITARVNDHRWNNSVDAEVQVQADLDTIKALDMSKLTAGLAANAIAKYEAKTQEAE